MSELAIGIDFGGTSIKTAVVEGGKIVQRGPSIETQRENAEGRLLERIFETIEVLRKSFPGVVAVGVGLPGFVDVVKGVVLQLSNVAGWDGVPFLGMLRERTGLRCAIENDANAMAYAEYVAGAARGAQNALCITLGTGVGGALVLGGRLYRGSSFAAGEIGHASIDYRGPRGVYDNPGDLEVYVGNRQIAARAARLYAAAGSVREEDACSPADLSRLAEEGDGIAIALWDAIGTEIGAALVNAVWLVNPDVIVIGGGVAAAGERVFGPVKRTLRERCSPVFWEKLRVVPAELGNDAGMLGCAALALEG